MFFGSCRKDPLGSDANEDRWDFSESTGVLALCDGASESFSSSEWAQILAEKFVREPDLTPVWLSNAIAEYVLRYDYASMSWSRQASYERGSFSTLLGVRHNVVHKTAEILAVGDSIAILADGGKIVSAWPFSDPERFKDRPTLLATLPEHNAFVSEETFWNDRGTHFDLSSLQNPLLVCVTDALGDWLLRSGDEALCRLLSVGSEDDLTGLVVGERSAGRMRTDDSTLIVVSFE